MQRNRMLCIVVVWMTLTGCAGLAMSYAADIQSDLGLNESTARDSLLHSLENGTAPVYLAGKAFKAASPSVRAALVNGALAWAKSYTQSPAFAVG